jgi:hypothetical protein
MCVSTANTTACAGWYAVGSGHERYWDGWAWTEHVRLVPAYVQAVRRQRPLAELGTYVPAEAISPN